MYSSQIDGNSLFSGDGFMPTQSIEITDSSHSSSKNRGPRGVFPLTVKQICEASLPGGEKSSFLFDGADAPNVQLLGLVMNKTERTTDVSFILDDGTGRIEINTWLNEASDTNEMAAIQNGMYVNVTGHLKVFQGKVQVTSFSTRPVIDFNNIAMHFLECIHTYLLQSRLKSEDSSIVPPTLALNNSQQHEVKGHEKIALDLPLGNAGSSGKSDDINDIVLGVFQEPLNAARDHGLHVDEVVHRVGVPLNKIRTAIDYLVNEGLIYSTIDDDHFKSAC